MTKGNHTIQVLKVCWIMLIVSIPLASTAASRRRGPKRGNVLSTTTTTTSYEEEIKHELFNCFCNLPKCGDQMKCATRYGCFTKSRSTPSDTDYRAPASSTSADSQYLDGDARRSHNNNRASNDSYGCLDMLSISKTCDQILQQTIETTIVSEYPKVAQHVVQDDIYNCCEFNMCNDKRGYFKNSTDVTTTNRENIGAGA